MCFAAQANCRSNDGVDCAVRRLAMTYDVRGLREDLTSYDNAAVGSGTIVNDVQFAYNDFSQLTSGVARPLLAVGLRSNKTYAPCGFHLDWKHK